MRYRSKSLFFSCGMMLSLLGLVSACQSTNSDTWILGQEKGKHVVKVEDHSDALLYFLKHNYKNRTVIHLDSHDDSRIVPDHNINLISKMASTGDYKALKEGSGISYGSNGKIFNIGNFLFAAYKLGVINQVYWVFPTDGFPEQATESVKKYLLESGFDQESVSTFHFEDGYIRGSRKGLPIVLCTQTDIPLIKETALVSLDVDYLMGMYGGPKKTPMGQLSKKLFDDLKASGIKTDFTVISYSVRGITLPLMHRYAGDYLYDFISNPASESQISNGLLKTRDNILELRSDNNFKLVIKRLNELLERDKSNASLYYDLALTHLFNNEPGLTNKMLEKAITFDPVYFLGYVEIGSMMLNSIQKNAIDKRESTMGFLKNASRFIGDDVIANRYLLEGNQLLFDGNVRKAQIMYSKALKQKIGITKFEFQDY